MNAQGFKDAKNQLQKNNDDLKDTLMRTKTL